MGRVYSAHDTVYNLYVSSQQCGTTIVFILIVTSYSYAYKMKNNKIISSIEFVCLLSKAHFSVEN